MQVEDTLVEYVGVLVRRFCGTSGTSVGMAVGTGGFLVGLIVAVEVGAFVGSESAQGVEVAVGLITGSSIVGEEVDAVGGGDGDMVLGIVG